MSSLNTTCRTHSEEYGSLRAGVGRREITASNPEKPVLDPLFVKALVFEDGSKKWVLVTMDAVAIGGICDVSDEFLPALRQRAERELGIPGESILVNASHTHPPGRILCSDKEQLENAFQAVREAAGALVPVQVGNASRKEESLTMNRNLKLKDGSYWTIRHTNPCPPEEEIAGLGRVDTEIGVLRVDRQDGSILAVVYNFACHLLFGNAAGSITANLVGVASGMIEEQYPDATAFFLQGAAGDVIDAEFKEFRRPRNIEPLGLRLGWGVLKTLSGIETKPARLEVISEGVNLPRRFDFTPRMAKLQEEQQALLDSLRYTALNFKSFLNLYLQHSLNPAHPAGDMHQYLHAEATGNRNWVEMDRFNRELTGKYLANIRAMERLARIQDDLATLARHEAINRDACSLTAPAEIQGIRIGDYVLLTAPLEVLTEVWLKIRESSPFKHTYLAAFSNGYLHYGALAEDYDKGNYEVTECLLAPEWEAIFESKVKEILLQLT